MKTSELLKRLKKHGCYLYEQGGNHEKWYSPVSDHYFFVPRHKNEVATGTANAILKQAGIK